MRVQVWLGYQKNKDVEQGWGDEMEIVDEYDFREFLKTII